METIHIIAELILFVVLWVVINWAINRFIRKPLEKELQKKNDEIESLNKSISMFKDELQSMSKKLSHYQELESKAKSMNLTGDYFESELYSSNPNFRLMKEMEPNYTWISYDSKNERSVFNKNPETIEKKKVRVDLDYVAESQRNAMISQMIGRAMGGHDSRVYGPNSFFR